jgi:hypothetical protein
MLDILIGYKHSNLIVLSVSYAENEMRKRLQVTCLKGLATNKLFRFHILSFSAELKKTSKRDTVALMC